ncbi:rCG40742 [Rattus norvegicus]|uniref:RCG40742 n=1 Tax=Rattus norvegicus TaxID=10116 RepID=A6KP22_RAT|nr:rCG40742 [Rattus norvegicus]
MLTGCKVIFAAINEGHPEVEEQVDEKGPSILRQEDRHPADLGPEVPEVERGCGAHRKLLQHIFIFQGLPLGCLGEKGLDFRNGGLRLYLVQEAQLLPRLCIHLVVLHGSSTGWHLHLCS